MASIPKIDSQQRVLQQQSLSNAGSGAEAFAAAFSQFAEKAQTVQGKMYYEQSSAMYSASVSDLEHLKSVSQQEMIQNPNKAVQIAKTAESTADIIKGSAVVNEGDRVRLSSVARNVSDSVNLAATRTAVDQQKLIAGASFYSSWPAQLKSYSSLVTSGKPEDAEAMEKAMMTNLRSLVETKVITPYQMMSAVKDIHGALDYAKSTVDMYGAHEDHHTAENYHKVSNSPFQDGAHTDPSAPVNQGTDWLMRHYNGDKSIHGVMSSILDRQLPDMETWSTLTPAQREKAIQVRNGVAESDSAIATGVPFPEIKQRYLDLKNKPSLSYNEIAQKKTYESFLSQLEHGEYLQVMSNSNIGASIIYDHTAKNSAIQTMMDTELKNTSSEDGKAAVFSKYRAMMAKNNNEFVQKSLSYAQAHHIPSEYVQPIPSSQIATVKAGLTKGGNPEDVFKVASQYDPQMQMYVANAIKNPVQRSVLFSSFLAKDSVPLNDKMAMISANQTNGLGHLDNYNVVQFSEKNIASSAYMRSKISSGLSAQATLLSQLVGPEAIPAMNQAVMNTAMYSAVANNDLVLSNLSDIDKYVEKASSVFKEAYKPISGSNFIANKTSLPPSLDESDLPILANYIVDRVNKEYMNRVDGPLKFVMDTEKKMRLTLDNNVQVLDAYSNVLYSEPYTDNMLANARIYSSEKEASSKPGLSSGIANLKKALGVK